MPSYPQDLAFDPERCDIAQVLRIGTLLLDDALPEDPQPLQECLGEDIAPLLPDPPCPDIQPLDWVSEQIPWISDDSVTPPRLTWRFEKGECCDFDLLIDLSGFPCVKLHPTDPHSVDVPFTEDNSKITAYFTRSPAHNSCDYDLTIDLKVHCPKIEPLSTVFIPVGTGHISYGFSRDPETCDYELTMDLVLPDGICPAIGPEGVTYSSFDSVVQGYTSLSIMADHDTCEFTLAVDTVITGFSESLTLVVNTDTTTLPPGTSATSSGTLTVLGTSLTLNISLGIPGSSSGVWVRADSSTANGFGTWPGFVQIDNGPPFPNDGDEVRLVMPPSTTTLDRQFVEDEYYECTLCDFTVTEAGTTYAVYRGAPHHAKVMTICVDDVTGEERFDKFFIPGWLIDEDYDAYSDSL